MKIFTIYAKVKEHEQVAGYIRANTREEAYEIAHKMFDNVMYLDKGKEVEAI